MEELPPPGMQADFVTYGLIDGGTPHHTHTQRERERERERIILR